MYSEGAKSWIKHLDFILFDVLSLVLAYTLSYFLRHKTFNFGENRIYLDLIVLYILIDLLVCVLGNSYHNVLKRSHFVEFKKTIVHVIWVYFIVIVILFLAKVSSEYSRQTLTLIPIIYGFILYAFKEIWKKIARGFVKATKTKALVIISSINDAEEIINDIRERESLTYSISSVITLEKDLENEMICGVPVVADITGAVDYLCNEWVDEVLLHLPISYNIPVSLVETFNQMGIVCHIATLRNMESTKIEQTVGRLGSTCVLTNSIRTVSVYQLFGKRIIDIIGGIVGTLLTGLLILVVGPMIYIADPGPIFFKQTRIGKNGKKFTIAKFRSMYLDAEERKSELMKENKVSDGKLFKMDEDPRIIGSKILPDGTYKKGIGNFIRDMSIDEFPQFINVLLGQMSIVGTRPPVEREWVLYTPQNRVRMAVKPGITGLWQVSGRSNITDFDEVVKLDSEYINTWTIGTDIKIIIKTIYVVLKRDGAV